MEKRLTAFLFRFILKRYFASKSEMARQLQMDIRQLQRVFRKLDDAKGGTIALDKLLLYCVKQGIKLDPIILEFVVKEGLQDSISFQSQQLFEQRGLIRETDGKHLALESLNEQGIEMAHSVMRIARAVNAVQRWDADKVEFTTMIHILRHVMETAYRFILQVYTKEAEYPLDCQ